MDSDLRSRPVTADDLAAASAALIAHLEKYRKVLLAADVPGPSTDELEATILNLGDKHRCWPAIRQALRAAPPVDFADALEPISMSVVAASASRLVVAWERIRRERVAALLDDLTTWLKP